MTDTNTHYSREEMGDDMEAIHALMRKHQWSRVEIGVGRTSFLEHDMTATRKEALEEAAQIIDGAAKAASKEGDLKRKREYEFRAALIREL